MSFSPLQPPTSQGGTSQGEGDPGDAVEKAGGAWTRCYVLSTVACSSVMCVPAVLGAPLLRGVSSYGPEVARAQGAQLGGGAH